MDAGRLNGEARTVDAATYYRANPVVSCGEEPDGAVLFNPDVDDTAFVNVSGRTLWYFLETPRTVSEMSCYLRETYEGVSVAQATEDVRQFVRTLTPEFVLEVDGYG